MTPRTTILWLGAWLTAPTLLLANLPPVEDAAPYRLVEGSTLTAECLPCGAPPVTVPIRGSFRLRPLEEDPLRTRYAVLDLSFNAWSDPAAYAGSGHGEYAQGGEVALVQEMRLEATIDGREGIVLTGEPAPVQAGFPWIEIALTETPIPGTGWFYRLHLVAAPWGRLRFSTAYGFHSSTAAEANLFQVSGGDLLAPGGWLLRSNEQLTARLGILPPVPDLGLDAAVGASRLDPAAPHEIRFSIEQDVHSETLGPLHPGDLLSEEGVVVRPYADLVRLFFPQPPVPDFGLDAVAMGPGLTTLFSIEQGFFSERLGAVVAPGDILSDDGSIFRTSAALLERFQPVDLPAGGPGLDAIHLWHHGEVWFSTETSFVDKRWGHVGHGDLLSDTGRVVARNLELLSRFAPLEDLADFGLDGLWIDPSPFLEDCGTLVGGAECLLFAADGGNRYVLETTDGFQAGDRVHVTGIVDPRCSTLCQENDGCVAGNTIRACSILPCATRPCEAPVFHRGDANDDGRGDISDGIFVLDFLFSGGKAVPCADAADMNDDERLDIADPIFLFGFLFLGAPPPPPPGPPPLGCGPDSTPATGPLGCEAFASC
jgi:hypothetical protein